MGEVEPTDRTSAATTGDQPNPSGGREPEPAGVQAGVWPGPGAPSEQGFGSFGYPPPSADFGPPSYPASGWTTPQPGQPADPAPYQPTAPGYRPGFEAPPYWPPGPAPGLQWGGVGVRLGALMIDAVIFVAVVFLVGAVSTVVNSPGPETATVSTPVLALALAFWLFALVYHPTCWYVFGASPGQKAVGLRVVRAADGEPLGLGAVLVRYLIFSFVTILVPLGIVSGFMTAKDPFKRAWHDQLASSIVVRRL